MHSLFGRSFREITVLIIAACSITSCDFIDSIFFLGTYEAVERCAERNKSQLISIIEARAKCATKHQFNLESISKIQAELVTQDSSISGDRNFILRINNNYDEIIVTNIDLQLWGINPSVLLYYNDSELWIEPGGADRIHFSDADLQRDYDLRHQSLPDFFWNAMPDMEKDLDVSGAEIYEFQLWASGIYAKKY